MKYHVTIKTLTPLHIGCGVDLLNAYDFKANPAEGKTYVLNQDAIYMEEFEAHGSAARLEVPAGQLMTLDHFQTGSKYVAYELPGIPRTERIQTVIKNHRREPFIPGSSLKGALRTALMARAIEQKVFVPDPGNLAGGAPNAAAEWERNVFGGDPNHSWMRAMQVADTLPLPLTASPLECVNVSVITDGRADTPIAVEAIRRQVQLETDIHIDELTLQYSAKLGWQGKDALLADFIEAVHSFSLARIQSELALAQAKKRTTQIDFYNKLLSACETVHARGGTVLQLGWGTGWNGTTVGQVLTADVKNIIREKYKLGRPQKADPRTWHPTLSRPFPASRRLAVPSERPLGWIALDFQAVKEPSEQWKELQAQGRAARPSRTSPAAPADQPAQAAPAAQPAPKASAAPRPARSVVIPSFRELPKPGDLFKGRVSDSDAEQIYLDVPGLEDALAVLRKADHQHFASLRTRKTILCQVVRLEEEKDNPGSWFVYCTSEE